MGSVREQALLFGARKSLVGIMTLPAPPASGADGPTIVILNSGIIHRVGANRMHVELARTLAALGFPVLRFDLSGIGDSEKRDDALAPDEAALADVGEALDHLESAGRTRGAVLVGLCSGANLALISAAADRRVVGLVLLDPFIPRTLGYHLRRYAKRVLRLPRWLGAVRSLPRGRRSLKQLLARTLQGPEPARTALSNREIHAILERAFQAAVERRVRLLAAFTSGLEDQHNYREQLLDAFPRVRFGGLLQLEFFQQSDHTFTSAAERARLFRIIRDWTQSAEFQVPAAPPPAAAIRGT